MTSRTAPAFTIGDAIAFGWERFKDNAVPLVVAALIVTAFNGLFTLYARAAETTFGYFVWQVLGWTVGTIVGMGWLRVSLKLVDGLTFDVGDFFPTGEQLVSYVVASILFSLAVAIGLIALVIPGVAFAVTFAFYGFGIVDKGYEAVESLQRSAELTRGYRLDILYFVLALIMLNIVGFLMFIVGILVTSGISLIAFGYVYRSLQNAAEPAAA